MPSPTGIESQRWPWPILSVTFELLTVDIGLRNPCLTLLQLHAIFYRPGSDLSSKAAAPSLPGDSKGLAASQSIVLPSALCKETRSQASEETNTNMAWGEDNDVL